MNSHDDRDQENSSSFPTGPGHHYVLAHLALRDACFENPYAFFGIVASPHREEFLLDVWNHVCDFCDDRGEPDFHIRDVQVVTSQIKGLPLILFLFPDPHMLTEVMMTAAVLKVPLSELSKSNPKKNPEAAYFTLELGMTMEGELSTVLGGWDKEKNHLNYGDGPAPHPLDFVEAIEKYL